MVGALLRWYAVEARDLPWRHTRDPYAILVSEVMLQQTQVARVVGRYETWLQRWPTAQALAAAAPGDVLREWVGLGYNRRALALWRAAGIVARDGWPERLEELPGVGPYTAAAVGAFAFGRDGLAIDVNVRRVLARHGGERPLAPGRAAELNQALIELGALVCRARVADCGRCPVAATCATRGIDAPPPRTARGHERFEDSNRWVRGRIVASLASGHGLPAGIEPERIERALDGLVRDGLVQHVAGAPALVGRP